MLTNPLRKLDLLIECLQKPAYRDKDLLDFVGLVRKFLSTGTTWYSLYQVNGDEITIRLLYPEEAHLLAQCAMAIGFKSRTSALLKISCK